MARKKPRNDVGLLPVQRRATRRPAVFMGRSPGLLKLIRGLVVLAVVSPLAWFIGFSLSIYVVEKLPEPGPIPIDASLPPGADTQGAESDVLAAERAAAASAEATRSTCISGQDLGTGNPATTGAGAPAVYAFLPQTSDRAIDAKGWDCGVVDVLMPQWHAFDAATGVISALVEDTGNIPKMLAGLSDSGDPARVLPVLSMSMPAELAEEATASPTPDAEAADAIARLVSDRGYSGLCVDSSTIPDQSRAAFTGLFQQIGARLKAMGRETCLIAGAESPYWRDDQILAVADMVVLLAFKQPQEGEPPGPLATQAWFERVLGEAAATIGEDRLVVALGNFGRDWIAQTLSPEPLAFAEAMRLAARNGGQIDFSTDALNSRIRLVDRYGQEHEIWLLDAVSLHNQMVALQSYHPRGVALWPVGLEDPGSWNLLGAGTRMMPEWIKAVTLSDYVGYDGEGAFMFIQHPAVSGLRDLTLDAASGLIRDQSYATIPEPFTVRRFGTGDDDMVVLTFDDGPDSAYTSDILDILKKEDVPAAFFTIGANILKAPDIVRRMVTDGHEVGSHTFFHPDLTFVGDLRSRMELSGLQRLLVSVTGYRSALFRSPYGRGQGPLTAAEARPFLSICNCQYVVVGSNVVPPDWMKLGPEEIVDFVVANLKPTGGNVIVLHDAGGDRSATVAAVPLLIKTLRDRGHYFVSLSTLLGVSRDVVMPPETGLTSAVDALSFALLGAVGTALRAIFWTAIGLGAVRAFAILLLVMARRHYPIGEAPYTPTVTVLVPAFNEEEGILDCIRTVRASDYPGLKVIVVDDGSSDHTSERVLAHYGDDPAVSIIRQPNGGKWMALDTAYSRVDTEVVVAIDADTVIRPDAIRKLVRAFRDPRVGAVAGKVQVGNQHSLLTRLQALEYIVAQNIDRRAAEVLNGMLVVPGAIGAWRVEAVRKAGFYTHETLAEDADLTVSILRAGFRVVYEEGAVSVTEAPETVRAFMRQRLRWTLGMMQAGWKHRRAVRVGKPVGLVSIPDLWLFGVGLSLLAPIADLVFLGVLLDMLTDAALGRPILTSPASLPILLGYLALPAMEALLALLAFAFERKAPTLVLLLPLQRLFYRQLLYITVYRAVWRALTGKPANWGKQTRTGTLQLPDA